MEYNAGIEELLPRATWFVTPPTEKYPSVVLGVTSDRLATPEGQAYFLTLSKQIPDTLVAPFVSVKYGSADDGVYYPFGANFVLPENWTIQALNDGNYSHLLFTKSTEEASYSLILARLEYIGFSVSFGF